MCGAGDVVMVQGVVVVKCGDGSVTIVACGSVSGAVTVTCGVVW